MSKRDAFLARMEDPQARRAVAVDFLNRFRGHPHDLRRRARLLAERIDSEDATVWRPAIAELLNEEPAATGK